MRYVIIAGLLLAAGCASTQQIYQQGFKDGFVAKTCAPFNYTPMPLYQGPSNNLILDMKTAPHFQFDGALPGENIHITDTQNALIDCRDNIGIGIVCP